MAGIQDDQQPFQIKDRSKLRVFSFYCKSHGSQNESQVLPNHFYCKYCIISGTLTLTFASFTLSGIRQNLKTAKNNYY